MRLIGNALKTHVTQPLDLMCKPLNLITITLWYPQMLTLLMRHTIYPSAFSNDVLPPAFSTIRNKWFLSLSSVS